LLRKGIESWNGVGGHVGIPYLKSALAEALALQGDLDAALGYLTEGVALCRQFTYAPPLATGLATLAWARQAGGDASGALDAMGEAERAMPGPAVGLLNPVPAQRARLLLAQGEVAAAARWTIERGLGPDDEPAYPREPEYLVLARVLLARDRPGPALALLDRMLAAAAAQDRAGSIIEIQALRALPARPDPLATHRSRPRGTYAHRVVLGRKPPQEFGPPAVSGSMRRRRVRGSRAGYGRWGCPARAGRAGTGRPGYSRCEFESRSAGRLLVAGWGAAGIPSRRPAFDAWPAGHGRGG
jgi:tetratricopeptide (TPR) repeat protein